MNSNEISALRRAIVKPSLWRIAQTADGRYRLQYSYEELPIRSDWCDVLTRTGRKYYRTSSTAMRDVLKVQPGGALMRLLPQGALDEAS